MANADDRPRRSAPRLPRRLPSRVVIESPRPSVDGDRFSAKTSVGEPVPFTADVFGDGHDIVAAEVRIRHENGVETVLPMAPTGNDRFVAWFAFDEPGRAWWTVHGWIDRWTTWRNGTRAKVDDGQDVAVELEVGARVIERAREDAAPRARVPLDEAIAALRNGDEAPLQDELLDELLAAHAPREPLAELGYEVPLTVDRARARCSAWYEFFPRSTVARPTDAGPTHAGPTNAGDGDVGDGDAGDGGQLRHGTLRDAVDRLGYIADLGFDVVYLPPIHPIGRTARKGPGNATASGPDDHGSPWAIGDADAGGGHTAVHPDLGTVDDLVDLVEAAQGHGMELALDIAFQCSPDHPWVSQHPEWFVQRPDGTIQYAENPPKKYQDIYPLDFESEDWRGLWKALRDVFLFWADRGVRVFRVDNPHTKAFAFWEWVIAAVTQRHPDTIFLSEAFTRPRVMQRLAKLGFTQSYTYFPWRNTAAELREYLTETAQDTVDYFRPNSWPTTPDILTPHLQEGGRAASFQRAVLAATLTANYGIYGPTFELSETTARPGAEEHVDSEKYELRHWDLDTTGSLAPLLRVLNRARRSHPALQWDRSLRFHHSDNDRLLCYSKTWPATGADGHPDLEAPPADRVLVVVNVDPTARHAGTIRLDLPAIGLEPGATFRVRDLIGGDVFTWTGADNYVDLDPHGLTAHLFEIEEIDDTEETA